MLGKRGLLVLVLMMGLAPGAASAALINQYGPTQITATASSYWESTPPAPDEATPPEAVIDGMGLGADDDGDGIPSHDSTYDRTVWINDLNTNVGDQWIAFDLGGWYKLQTMRVWNLNQGINDLYETRGLLHGFVFYSVKEAPDPTNPADWTKLGPGGFYQFKKATGEDDYDDVTDVNFGNFDARHVMIDVVRNWGLEEGEGFVGFSEIQFFGVESPIPEPGTLALVVLGGGVTLMVKRRRTA